jgi:WD40 repeat protein
LKGSNSCVTALDMPDDSQILIFGDSVCLLIFYFFYLFLKSGNLTIWDVENKKEIKTFEKLIDNGIQSVISLSRSEKFRLLITTSKGQIYCVTISKIFFAYTADKKVLLNGAYGLITSLKFNIPNSNMDHPLDAMELYAFSTWDTVYIIRNENQHIDTLDRPPHVKRGAPADISWKYRSIDFNSLNLKNSSYIEQDFFAHPVLAISWGNMLFIKVYTLRDGSNHADAKFVGTFTMPFIIKAVSWLSGKVTFAILLIFNNFLVIVCY